MASKERDNDLVFIGYVETTLWVCALDDLLVKADPNYEVRRDGDEGGNVLRGLRWARNQGVHQLIALHRDAGGFKFPMTFPASTTFEPVWLPRSEVPPPDQRQHSGEAYDLHVACRSVYATLHQAQDFLWMRAMPDTGEPPPWLP